MAADAWQDATLADIMDVKHGFAFPGEHIRDEPPGDILLTPGNFAIGGGFKGDSYKYFNGPVPEQYVLHENDLILTMTDLSKQSDTLGYPALVPKPLNSRFLHNQRLGKVLIRDGAKIDKRFLSYLLRTPQYRHEILASATGTTVKHTSPSRILAFKTSIPPLVEQRAISHILGTLDDRIDLNRLMNETLEAMARGLFESWFVDFDPVRAKAEGRDPGLPKPIADLFPDAFEDSHLGEIPKEWRVATVEEVAKVNAHTLSRTDRLDVIDYIEISEAMGGEVGTIARYERGTEPSRARRRLGHGDTVISTVRPDRGAHFLCLDPPETLIASTGFAVLTPRDGSWAFLYSALTRRDVADELGRLADGGAYPAVRAEAVGGLKVVLPTTPTVLSHFERFARPLFERSAKSRVESHSLAALRDALLPKLLSGELCVAGLDSHVGRHA